MAIRGPASSPVATSSTAAPAATADNKLAVGHNQKFKKLSAAEREAMKVDAPFPDVPAQLQSAAEAYLSVLGRRRGHACLPAMQSICGL